MATATDRWHGLPRLAVALLVLGLAGGMPAGDAAGQAKKKEPDAASQKDSAAVQRAYAAGTKAFEGGNMAEAERQLSVALSGGGLPNPQMAKALYMRGTAYRQLGKPAQAISDLTTAVWLKGGLSEADKKAATAERQLAYREAGLGDTPPPIGAAPLDQSPTTSAAASAPASGAQVATVGPSSFWSNLSLPTIPNPFSTASSAQPAAAPAAGPAPAAAATPVAGFAAASEGAPAAAAPAQEFATAAAAETAAPVAQTSSWDTQTAAAAEAAPAPAQQVAAAGYAPVPEATGLAALPGGPGPAPAPALVPEGQSDTASNPLAGFFSNVFGSGSSASSEAAPVTTGSTNPASDWGSDTTVTTAQTSSMVQRGPESPPPAAAAPVQDELPWTAAPAAAQPAPAKKVAAAKPAGRYKLQVAAVRTREEAERLAETLRSYQAVQAGIVSPEVDEAVIGNMGTFYRVRLGPYADAGEPGQLCQALKPQGFDCLVVTQ